MQYEIFLLNTEDNYNINEDAEQLKQALNKGWKIESTTPMKNIIVYILSAPPEAT